MFVNCQIGPLIQENMEMISYVNAGGAQFFTKLMDFWFIIYLADLVSLILV